MDFVGAIQAGFKNYANFRGVAGRAEYWYFVLFIFLSSLVLSVLDSLTGTGILGLAFSLGTLLPSLSVLVRRLRDAGYSWTWLLVQILATAIFIVGLVGIVNIGIESGLFSWQALMEPESEITPEAVEALASNPNFFGFAAMTMVGLLLAGITSLVVNIIFPLMPSKSVEQGNKRIRPETL